MFSVFKNINKYAGKNRFLDALAIFCARYLLYILLAVLLVNAFVIHSLAAFFIPLAAGLLAAFFGNKIIYIFYKKDRPAELKSTNLLIPIPHNPSFPSRHASLMFGVSFCLLFYSVPLAIIFLVFSCIIGVSRVFCGVHWFSDIVAGALMGFLFSIVVYTLLHNL